MTSVRPKFWAWLIVAVFMLLASKCSHAAITDGKFGVNQIFDVQYWWNGNTLNASNFIAPYNKNFQTVTVTTGQYFQFFPSTTNPGTYGLKLMNSDGTQHSIVHDYGDITALGSGAIFYIGSGFFGNVITTSKGYSYGASDTFTNMDTSVTSTDLNNYTFASSTPLASGQTATSSSSPTVVSTSTTNSTTTNRVTTVTYDNTENKTRAKFGVGGQVSNYTDSARSKIIQYDDTTTTTPTTTTTYSDGSTTSSVGSSSSSTVTSYDYDVSITRGTTATPLFTIFSGNSIYIDQKAGSANNNITIEQSGPRNAVMGTTNTYATVSGQTNNLYINQGSNSLPNLVQFSLTGNNNVLSTNQGYNVGATPATSTKNLSDSGGHIQYLDISGSFNNIGIEQTNNGGLSSGHYVQSTIIGSTNTFTVKQNNDVGKESYTDIVGASNNIAVTQKGTGQHYADINVYGNGNVISLTQDSNASKLATINATNAGGANNISVSQTGSTSAGIVVNQTCAAGTCGLTVSQVK